MVDTFFKAAAVASSLLSEIAAAEGAPGLVVDGAAGAGVWPGVWACAAATGISRKPRAVRAVAQIPKVDFMSAPSWLWLVAAVGVQVDHQARQLGSMGLQAFARRIGPAREIDDDTQSAAGVAVGLARLERFDDAEALPVEEVGVIAEQPLQL